MSNGREGEIEIWDAATGRELHSFNLKDSQTSKQPSSSYRPTVMVNAALSADGKAIAAGCYGEEEGKPLENTRIRLLDTETGNELPSLDRNSKSYCAVAFLPDNKTLASRCGDGSFKLQDIVTGQEIRSLDKHSIKANSLLFAISTNGKILATVGQVIKLWNLESGKELRLIDEYSHATANEITAVALSPDGKTLASGGWDKLVLWDVETGKQLHILSAR